MTGFVVKPVRKKEFIEAILDELRENAGEGHNTNESREVPMVASPSVAPGDSDVAVDGSAFDSLVAEIGLEAAQQTLSVFMAETDDRLKRLRRLSCDKDREAIQQEAHGLKGAAGNFGMRQVSDLAKKLEHGAATISANGYAEMVGSIERSYAAAQKHFAALAT